MAEPRSINELNNDLFQPEEVDSFADPVKIRKKAMDFLARREYGRDELVRKLATAGYEADRVATEVDRLRGEGLQCDTRFAEAFVSARVRQGKGPTRILQELEERGLDSSTIYTAIDDSGEDWFELARTVREKKFGSQLPGAFPQKAKQMRFLQQRGFDNDQIQAAFRPHGDQ